MYPRGLHATYAVGHYDPQQEGDCELDPVVAVKMHLRQQVGKRNTDKGACRKSQGRGHHVVAAISQDIDAKEK